MPPRNRHKRRSDTPLDGDGSPKRVKAEPATPQRKTTKQPTTPKKSGPVPNLAAAPPPIQHIRIVNPDALNLFSSVTV
jgi:hypothetical protein